MCGWNKNCAIKWKNNAYCNEYVRSGDTLFESPTYENGYYCQFAFFVHMHIIVVVIIVIS